MLVARRGAVLLLVLGVAVALLGLLAAAFPRLAWSHRAARVAWEHVGAEFAVMEVRRAAARSCAPPEGTVVRLQTTTNRTTGRIELVALAPPLWRVRWGVAGAGAFWRTGGWLAVAVEGHPDCPTGSALIPLPGLPSDS